MSTPVIGIDLGTTSARIAVVEGGVGKVIPDEIGRRVTPAMVAATKDGQLLVGHDAAVQARNNALEVVYSFKRLIGRRWSSPAVAAALEMYPYKLVEGPHHGTRVVLHETTYSIPEISALVLEKLKADAERYLGRVVEQCVISVPAYFDQDQRQATKDAGRIAGLEVLRLINEPTAAALAFGHGQDHERTVAVFDLGSGTFDLSIVETAPGLVEVIASAGDAYLGGDDFDQCIIEWLVQKYCKVHHLNRFARQRLQYAAERAKRELSVSSKTEIHLPGITCGQKGPLDLQCELTREKFEELVADLCERCIQITDKTLKDAGARRAQLAEVLLVGAQTHMPRIQELVQGLFGLAPVEHSSADEAVALGAAICGASLLDERSSLQLIDVIPRNLGLIDGFVLWYEDLWDGKGYQTLIEKNTSLPTTAKCVFATLRDDQPAIRLLPVQGDYWRWDENDLVAELILDGLPPRPKGGIVVELTTEVTADGIVAFSAKDLETGRSQNITVVATPRLTEDEIRQIIAKRGKPGAGRIRTTP